MKINSNSLLKHSVFLASIVLLAGAATPAFAICPVCTIAVGAGIGLSRYLGIDDSVTGLWIGGLTVSMILWTFEWMKKRNYRFPWQTPVIWLGYYAIIILPLYFKDIFGHPLNKLWGMDKLALGIAIGSVAFFAGGMIHFHEKKRKGKVHFPFQKVAFSVGPLVVLSLVFYLITK